jgi:hypothetical protein
VRSALLCKHFGSVRCNLGWFECGGRKMECMTDRNIASSGENKYLSWIFRED